jgi:hypothetical protein
MKVPNDNDSTVFVWAIGFREEDFQIFIIFWGQNLTNFLFTKLPQPKVPQKKKLKNTPKD